MAGWRTLFAIGGAPAASHATLSRAPSSGRLLDPLAGARLTDASRLNALVAPLDLAGMFARVSAPASVVENTEARESLTRNSRAGATTAEPEARGASTRVADDVARAPVRRKLPGKRKPTTLTLKRAVLAMPPEVAATDRDVTSRPVSARRRKLVGESRRVGASTTRVASVARAGLAAVRNFRDEARGGSDTPVVVATPLLDTDRLQAIAAPASPVEATVTSSTGAAASTSEPGARELSRVLNDAADRARTATRTAVSAPREPRAAATVDSTRLEPERATGFRGLAMRTLTPSRVPTPVPAQRVEPEARVSNDLTLDTIDARVADSLARLLEREARRHGIEITEAR